jgi:hypothetical protein
MNVYVYKAELLCEDCGKRVIDRLRNSGTAEDTGDSDDWPQGQFRDGGGEADFPLFCASNTRCVNAWTPDGWQRTVGAFLQNPLTSDGVRYMRNALMATPTSPVVQMCARYYYISL